MPSAGRRGVCSAAPWLRFFFRGMVECVVGGRGRCGRWAAVAAAVLFLWAFAVSSAHLCFSWRRRCPCRRRCSRAGGGCLTFPRYPMMGLQTMTESHFVRKTDKCPLMGCCVKSNYAFISPEGAMHKATRFKTGACAACLGRICCKPTIDQTKFTSDAVCGVCVACGWESCQCAVGAFCA